MTNSDDSDSSSGNEESQFLARQQQKLNRKKRKSGGFQSMGLSDAIFNAIQKKGYKIPTPIQRKTIPLIVDGKDMVAMARTGSGKTAAFLIPMLEKLKSHSVKVGARALILSPTRELAMQTVKFCKELGKYTDLRCASILGGDSLDEQFSQMASNPDIIIATPGRLVHLMIEMNLDLKTVEYLVFDEADRLFEMGFSSDIQEIMQKLSENRQTVLFSATLPKMLVDFAKAGLTNPTLVRLDVDNKISPDLSLAFFLVKSTHKDAALLFLIQNVVKSDQQTIIFASTRHHVEYLHQLLDAYQIQNSYIYGSLDQEARQINLNQFRNGDTKFLIVTDVAARGIDIPFLNNVIHYDFCDRAKIFVHRSGRAARAGRSGTAYALLTNEDIPYLIDLQLFLGRSLTLSGSIKNADDVDLTQEMVFGDFPGTILADGFERCEELLKTNHNLFTQRKSSDNGFKLYMRTRAQASKESYIRSKKLMEDAPAGSCTLGIHPILRQFMTGEEQNQVTILDRLKKFRPPETIFEFKKMGQSVKNSEADAVMKARRQTVGSVIHKVQQKRKQKEAEQQEDMQNAQQTKKPKMEGADDAEITNTFETIIAPKASREARDYVHYVDKKERRAQSFKDEEYFIPHAQPDSYGEKGYSVHDGPTSFLQEVSKAQMDLVGDDTQALQSQNRLGVLKWDKNKKKFSRQAVGADNKKMIRSSTGKLLPASYKSDSFQNWKKKNKVDVQRPGEYETSTGRKPADISLSSTYVRKFKHNKNTAPKALDRLSTSYERKMKELKAKAKESGESVGKLHHRIKSEIKTTAQVKKERILKEQRREKNARPSKSKKGGVKSKGGSKPKGGKRPMRAKSGKGRR